jgi:hypothetical protein
MVGIAFIVNFSELVHQHHEGHSLDGKVLQQRVFLLIPPVSGEVVKITPRLLFDEVDCIFFLFVHIHCHHSHCTFPLFTAN